MKKVVIDDVSDGSDVQVLIGVDGVGKRMTEKIIQMECGLNTLET